MSVPRWSQLPPAAQAELAGPGYGESWFDDPRRSDEVRLTVLNLYVKLKGLNLWKYVGTESSTGTGTLEFLATNVRDFKEDIKRRDEFTDPEESLEAWSSREKRSRGSLHLKHFKGWPEKKVQAHIDPTGLLFRSAAWWLMPLIPLGLMLAHLIDYGGYQDVFRIRDILLSQGWWSEPLLGVGVRSPIMAKRQAHAPVKVSPYLRLELGRLRGHGRSLDNRVREPVEAHFGHDFSAVRLHTEPTLADTASSLGMDAFTVGNDIVFGSGQYRPHTRRGHGLLAHELAHVIQQEKSNGMSGITHAGERLERDANRAEASFLAGPSSVRTDQKPSSDPTN